MACTVTDVMVDLHGAEVMDSGLWTTMTCHSTWDPCKLPYCHMHNVTISKFSFRAYFYFITHIYIIVDSIS